MKAKKNILIIFIVLVMFIENINTIPTKAEDSKIPKFKVKYINEKTGIKIIIGKTSKADGYRILLKGCGNSYLNYWLENDKTRWFLENDLKENGKKKRTYSISGLPKGTYSIKVITLEFERGEYLETEYSYEKRIKIKASKDIINEEVDYNFSKVKVGDTITFGHYEQDDIMTNGQEPIEWIVLSKDKTKMLVLSKYALDYVPYNTEYADVTWETCTLRKWLNNVFYKAAFSASEKMMIKKTYLSNSGFVKYGKIEYNEKGTEDNIFLLTEEDLLNEDYGFSVAYYDHSITRRCAPTAYATANRVKQIQYSDNYDEIGRYLTKDGEKTCRWYLRSPGSDKFSKSAVSFEGYLTFVNLDYTVDNVRRAGVRPALYIDLTK